ncbi:ExeM/NucH family extracellular endonuclease [Microbacterium sp. 2FI]|uniref:ExeM/NucH family extracellular endonuclease n=1 Tax=Microbacterium sp. 2FI TaxID=2502193 RepID=UPI002016A8B1|nr:ExeM/NucH family extracellular endonuclease [Microbacterium sp. 2FI]
MRHTRRVVAIAAAGAIALTGLIAPAASAAEAPTELFISEYVEGSSTNKAIEIYNGTGAAVDLAAGGYALRVHSNGNVAPGLTVALTGSVAAGDVYVFADNLLADYADQTTGASLFNGNDAVTLVKAGTVIDSLGQVGVDPGAEWGTGLTSTANNTLRRNADACAGDTTATDAFDPSLEWTGFAQDTFDGLGSHTVQCGDTEPPTATVKINEFLADHDGTDTIEYIEFLATPGAVLTGYAALSIEGDLSGTATGTVDRVVPVPASDETGRSLATLPGNALENGTMSLLLVTGTLPVVGTDIDTNDDGVIDDGLGFTVVDAVAVNDGGPTDLAYGGVVLAPGYDGVASRPGGASRIPDGVDTDTTSDWTRNDYQLAGIPTYPGTLVDGEAVNTPGAPNTTELPVPEVEAGCELPVVTISSVQGDGAASDEVGEVVRIQGTVVGDFQTGGFNGYYVQDAGDGLTATSDGIFVFAQAGVEVKSGDVVNVVGTVSEYFGMTQITQTDIEICAEGQALPAATPLTLPATVEQREALEGMRVTLPQPLAILEFFEFGRFGTISLGIDRQYQPTATYAPGSDAAKQLAADNILESITLDDGRGTQNPNPALHPNGLEFTLENTFRGGDIVDDATGVLDYRFDTWAIQPTQPAVFTAVNERPAVPEFGGDLVVSSFNVLNYFTTIDPTPGNSDDDDLTRGADTVEEFERQEAKIVAALAAIDADVFGLIEIENNDDVAVETLTEALNDHLGADVYTYVPTGVVGTDAITTALLYKASVVTPVGDFQLMNESKDTRWLDRYNRPGLTQTFADAAGGEFTVVVNHLKSKGSDCNAVNDPEDADGQGDCNGVRTAAANALADWLATDPTGQDTVGRELIIGDLNAYDKEDPIAALKTAGYTDLLLEYQGEDAYSYVFDGQLGYLDHALAGPDLVADVRGASTWYINADEPSLIDYDTSFKQPAQDALWAPDPFRSSDHDPVLVGLELTPPDTTPPTIEVTADPWFILAPNNKLRDVQVDIVAADDRGDVTVELTDISAEGHPRAEITDLGDGLFQVKAVNGAVYRITYTATDAAGNSASDTAIVIIGVKGLIGLQ